MKKRTYHYIFNNEVKKSYADQTSKVRHEFSFEVKTLETLSQDTFDGELVVLGFPIGYMNHIDSILRTFNLREDVFYFFQQCQDVISVPEKHINEQGKGRLNFQSYFKNIPYSIASINDTAMVVVALEPKTKPSPDAPADYFMVGYIHGNEFECIPDKKTGELLKGYYFNMLRVSVRRENGRRVYRRKKIFTLMFSVVHGIARENGIHTAFASMGRENQAIKEALHRNVESVGAYYERLPFKMYSKINLLFGSRKHAKKLINITEDKARLAEMYAYIHQKMNNYMFYHLIQPKVFYNLIDKVKQYSKNSGVYMIANEAGEMQAATLALHWGDYFSLTMENATGFLRPIAALQITEKILYPILSIGDVKSFKQLMQGLAHLYRKQHGTHLTFFSSYEGDPYFSVKKSLIDDDYAYFITSERKEELISFKEMARGEDGIVRLFIDQPLV